MFISYLHWVFLMYVVKSTSTLFLIPSPPWRVCILSQLQKHIHFTSFTRITVKFTHRGDWPVLKASLASTKPWLEHKALADALKTDLILPSLVREHVLPKNLQTRRFTETLPQLAPSSEFPAHFGPAWSWSPGRGLRVCVFNLLLSQWAHLGIADLQMPAQSAILGLEGSSNPSAS